MHEEQSRFRRSLARWAVVVHGNGAPGPDLDLHDGKLGLDDGMPRAANLRHLAKCEHVRQHGALTRTRGTSTVSRSLASSQGNAFSWQPSGELRPLVGQQMLGWFPGDGPRAQPQAWDGSFHVASCLDQAPVVRGSKVRKNRTRQLSVPDVAAVGFRGLQQRSLDQQRSLASASAPTSLFGLGSAGALRPISSAGAVHAGSAAYLSLGASSGQEAELVTRLARLKGELHAARQQHAVAMQEARQGAEQLDAARAALGERRACLMALREEARVQGKEVRGLPWP